MALTNSEELLQQLRLNNKKIIVGGLPGDAILIRNEIISFLSKGSTIRYINNTGFFYIQSSDKIAKNYFSVRYGEDEKLYYLIATNVKGAVNNLKTIPEYEYAYGPYSSIDDLIEDFKHILKK